MVLYEGIPPCRCGGIGRRTGLKIPRRKSYGFDPRHRYHVRRSKHRSVSASRRKLHYVSSFFLSESNPLRWASIYFFYNKAGKHNLCLPAFAYSFGFPFLLFEKRYYNSAGARMGSDHTSYGRIANFFQVSFPDVTAVFDIF